MPHVRMAAMAALGQLAGPEHVAGMLKGLLKAEPGPEREAAEKAVMFVCNRIADASKRAEPLLAAWAGSGPGRAARPCCPRWAESAGPRLLRLSRRPLPTTIRSAATPASAPLCNWPDASVAPQADRLGANGDDANHRLLALRALIRVAALPDNRPDAQRLDLLKKAMTMATATRSGTTCSSGPERSARSSRSASSRPTWTSPRLPRRRARPWSSWPTIASFASRTRPNSTRPWTW